MSFGLRYCNQNLKLTGDERKNEVDQDAPPCDMGVSIQPPLTRATMKTSDSYKLVSKTCFC